MRLRSLNVLRNEEGLSRDVFPPDPLLLGFLLHGVDIARLRKVIGISKAIYIRVSRGAAPKERSAMHDIGEQQIARLVTNQN